MLHTPDVDLGTDPRAPCALPLEQIPGVVGAARVVCGEARVVCDTLIRDCAAPPVMAEARRLRVAAIRLGQAATALSAVEAGPDVLVWTRPRLPLPHRLYAALRAAWIVMRG